MKKRDRQPAHKHMNAFKKKRLEQLMKKPLPVAWQKIITENVPYSRCLPPGFQKIYHGLIRMFLEEKHFEGCDGLRITDEIRLTIAAQACILLLGQAVGSRKFNLYPKLSSILVYPHAYVAHRSQRFPDGIVTESEEIRIGETWSKGSLVLAWDDVRQSAFDIHDGHNVVFHEFAHQLDYESGAAEGTPRLTDRSSYIAWARVLGREYEMLVKDIAHHRKTLLDDYGATNPAEFFAVTTEFFFEKPIQIKKRHPELYEQLKLFYNQDPASFLPSCEK
jgi:Mlc titration factor MtfA (ptsG expression regulator)